jgi:diguanylate cyclase (GGDEF)-like protein
MPKREDQTFFISENQIEEIVENLAAEPVPEEAKAYARFTAERIAVYKMIISNVLAEPIPDEQVAPLWRKLIHHKYILSEQIGRNVGLRVAAMDYLFNLTHRINNPSIIENETYQQLMSEAQLDFKTGVSNARTLYRSLDREIDRSRRYGLVFSVAIFDLDHFKAFNDRIGHIAGDNLLRAIADALNSCLRTIDLPARFGGDEFCVLFPQTFANTAETAIERLRTILESEVMPRFSGAPRVSLSAGIAMYPFDGTERVALLRSADRTLYRAKESGRDRILLSDDEPRIWVPAVPCPLALDSVPLSCKEGCLMSRSVLYLPLPEGFPERPGTAIELVLDRQSDSPHRHSCTPDYVEMGGKRHARIPIDQDGELLVRLLVRADHERSFQIP